MDLQSGYEFKVKEIETKIKKDKEAMIVLKEKEIASQHTSLQAKAKELQARED
jgi:hypothetical protein